MLTSAYIVAWAHKFGNVASGRNREPELWQACQQAVRLGGGAAARRHAFLPSLYWSAAQANQVQLCSNPAIDGKGANAREGI